MYPKVWEQAASSFWDTALGKSIKKHFYDKGETPFDSDDESFFNQINDCAHYYWSSRKPHHQADQKIWHPTLTEALEADGWKTIYDSEGNICWYENENRECKPVDTEIDEASKILARAIYNVERK